MKEIKGNIVKEINKCNHCGDIPGKTISDGDHNYCDSCFREHYERCYYCGKIHNRDRMYWRIDEETNCCFKCLGYLDIINELTEKYEDLEEECENLEEECENLKKECENLKKTQEFVKALAEGADVIYVREENGTGYYDLVVVETEDTHNAVPLPVLLEVFGFDKTDADIYDIMGMFEQSFSNMTLDEYDELKKIRMENKINEYRNQLQKEINRTGDRIEQFQNELQKRLKADHWEIEEFGLSKYAETITKLTAKKITLQQQLDNFESIFEIQ